MSTAYGMPGIGGSLGRCCYCGDTFLTEILLGTTCIMVSIGGQDMFVHKTKEKNCLEKLEKLAEEGEGKIQLEDYDKLPEGSPLREAMWQLLKKEKKDSI